jgi:hypothetical protein
MVYFPYMGKTALQESYLLAWLEAAFRSRLGEAWRVSLAAGEPTRRARERAQPSEVAEGGARWRTPDAILTLRAPDGQRVVLLVQATSKASLGAAEQAARLQRGVAAEAQETARLLVAPYIGPRVREACRARGVAYADQTGAWRLRTQRPAIDWEVGGAEKNPTPERRGIASLLGPSTARVLRTLVDSLPPYTLTELAATARVTPATAYKVVTLLEGEGLVAREARGSVTEIDWQGLLQRWAQEYKFEKQNRVVACLAARGPQAVLAQLKEEKSAATEPGTRWALTGAWATRSEFDSLAGARLVIYTEQPTRLQELLGLKPWKGAGSNAAVVVPRDPLMLDEAVERDGLTCAPWSQIAIDLLGGRDRDPSVGENLLSWMSLNEPRWRTGRIGTRDRR